MRFTRRDALALSIAALAASSAAAQDSDPQNTLILETKNGKIVIKLRPDLAPKHVAQIKTLWRANSMTASSFIG